MSTRRVRPEDMKPGRKYVIEIPASFAGKIDCGYDEPRWSESIDMSKPSWEVTPVRHNTVTLRFSNLNGDNGGIVITEHLVWEDGEVYRDKVHGRLYLRQDSRMGWVRLPARGGIETLFISDISASGMDFERNIVKLVEEK